MSDHSYLPAHHPVVTAVVTEGINITSERAGNDQRQAAIRHVEAQLRGGFLDGDEAGRRVAFLGKAVTQAQIKEALTDLRPMPGPPQPRINWGSPAAYVPFLVALIAVFASTGIIGGLLISDAEPAPGLGVYLAGVPLLVSGIFGFLVSLIELIVKLDDE